MADVQTIKDWLGHGSINLFGVPFAGKDTQGKKLADILDAELVAGGDILRHYHDQEKLQALLASGELIPSDMYLDIVLPYLSQDRLKEKALVLSSVGRKKGEESVILEATEKSGHAIKAVVLLTLSEEEVWKRFEASKTLHDRGVRGDDNAEVLKTRLSEFQEDTMPVIDAYREKGLLLEVDGGLSREEVTDAILASLEQASLA